MTERNKMRLMLGTPNNPSLLVNVTEFRASKDFDFFVVNGGWEGTLHPNGRITIWHPDNPWSDLDINEILCDNQDRLRGDYNTVFCNFSNPDYVAPKPKELPVRVWQDDDIPF